MPHVDLSTVNVDELFRIIDADGSGNISFMEFMKWYKGHHKATGKAAGTMFAEAKRIFGELDDDDSGSLEKPEIAELLRRLPAVTTGAGARPAPAAACAKAAASVPPQRKTVPRQATGRFTA